MLNTVVLMGRLTKDPEIAQTQSGISVCRFSVAVDSGYGDGKNTDFINCVAWRGTADFLSKYFGKGQMIAIVGRISTRTWEGTDGKKNYATEVIANEVSFCGSKVESQNATPNTAPAEQVDLPNGFVGFETNEDLPF